MNFVGTGIQLTDRDVENAAGALGVEPAIIRAFIEVESSTSGFDRHKRPTMLRETHVFYRELGPGEKRDRAEAAGLANPTWVRNYNVDLWRDLDAMIAIDRTAALRSCSWGIGQVMGRLHREAGFATVDDMVAAMMRSEADQLRAMVNVMREWGLQKYLVNRDFTNSDSWRDAAKRYNGSGYASHDYHGRIAAAYRKLRYPVLRRGATGLDVATLQTRMIERGFQFQFGLSSYNAETEYFVQIFQKRNGLTVDGIAGPATFKALE